MSSLFGAKKSAQQGPVTALQVQTSVQGLPIPLVWGKTRVSGNIIYYGDFTSYSYNASSSSGGKGGILGGSSGGGKGGSGSLSYNYQVAVAIALCAGTIESVDSMWTDKTQVTPSSQGFTVFPGDFNQTAWGRLTSLHPDQALNYRGLAYVASFLYLGGSTQLPNLSFEVHSTIADAVSGAPDADPSAVITDFLTNPNSGVGLPTSRVGDLTTYTNYCRATGMLVSPAITDLTSGQDFVNMLLEATNSEAVWSQGTLKIVPYGDQTITAGTVVTVTEEHAVVPDVPTQLSFPGVFVADLGVTNADTGQVFTKVGANPTEGQYVLVGSGGYSFNGSDIGTVLTFSYSYTEPATYTAPTQPLYAFTDDDFITGGSSDADQPVLISRSAPQAAKNSVVVNYTDRANAYALTPTPAAKDDAAIQMYGLQQDAIRDYHFFQYAQAAQMSAHLALGRNAVRNTYTFTVGQKYKLLDPMDLVSLTDIATGLNAHWARITEITENDDGTLTMTAEDYLSGTAAAPKYSAEANAGYTANYLQDPGYINAPVIFEPPSTLTGGTTELWIAVSGASAVWGGCDAYVSYDDENYSLVPDAHQVGPARNGYTTAALTTDAAATLSVDISQVPSGQLTTVTATEAASLATLCYVDGELIAYTTATLTASGKYTLGGLIRGAYGTPITAHAAGTQFARIDQNIIKVPYNKALIGGAIFLKFLSFNIWFNSEQTLAEVTEIEYTFGGGQPPGVITGIKASAAQSGLAMTLIASWSADALSATYQAGISQDNGVTWQDIYDGSDLSTRVDGLKATVSILFHIRGVTSSGIPGVYAVVPVSASGITAGASGYQEVVGYVEISASVIDAALLPDYNADLAELAQFATTVSQGKAATAALQQANAAAAGVLQLASGVVPSLAYNLAAQTTGLTQQIASINSALMTQIAQESSDVIALGGRVDTLSASIGSNSAFTTGISLAQANINSSNAIQLDEIASQEASDNDSGELADFVNLVQQNEVAQIKANQEAAAQSAIVVQQATNTTAIAANALYATTLASQVSASFAMVSQEFTTQTTATQALSARTTTLESTIGDPTTGLAATYSDVVATSTVVNDPTYGNYALATDTTNLSASIATNTSSISSIQAVNASQDSTIASLQTTVSSNYSSLNNSLGLLNNTVTQNSSSIQNLSMTQASQASTIATLQTTETSNYSSLNGSIGSLNTAVTQNSSSIQSLSMTVATQAGSLATLSTQVGSNYTSQGALIAQNSSSITTLQQTASTQAGTIATLSTGLASAYGGGNMIQNSDLMSGYDGWSVTFSNSNNTTVFNYPGFTPVNNLPGVLAGIIYAAGNPTSNDTIFWRSPMVPVSPGAIYELSFEGAFYGARVQVAYAQTLDASGNAITNLFAGQGGKLGGGQNGDPANYGQVGGFVTIPAGVSYIAMLCGTIADGSGGQCTGFITRPQIRVAAPGQQVLSPYSPGTQANVVQINAAITNVQQTAASANAATASQISQVQAQINNSTTGLAATYTAVTQTQALTNDPTYGNVALSAYQTNLNSDYQSNKANIYGNIISLQSSRSTDEGNISALQTMVTSNYNSNSASITSLQGTVANQSSTLSSLTTTVSSNYSDLSGQIANTNNNVASNSNSITTLSNDYGSLSQQVQSISAQGANGTAGGQVIFSAQSAPSGVTARFAVTLNASGQQSATGGFALDLVNGAVAFTVQASTFRVEDPNTRFVPFAILNGALVLQGATYINSVIQSNSTVTSASTNASEPVMAIDFQNGSITIYDPS